MPAIIILYQLSTAVCAFLDNQKAVVSVSVKRLADVVLFLAVAAILSHRQAAVAASVLEWQDTGFCATKTD